MKVLDLFSGIGAFSLGLERVGMQTIQFVEKDKKCFQVLKKHWPNVPIHHDIRSFDGKGYRGTARLVCGGPPCQSVSLAGEQAGTRDDRWLWEEALRVVSEVAPEWCIFENVYGLLTIDDGMAFEALCLALEDQGFEVQPYLIGAISVNAPHIRSRVWIVAHAFRDYEWEEPCSRQARRVGREYESVSWNRGWQEALCHFRGMDDGSAYKVHRVNTIRNAVCPQVVEQIGKAIMEF